MVGAGGREGATQRLVRAAVDLGLQFGSDRVERLLEVGVIAAVSCHCADNAEAAADVEHTRAGTPSPSTASTLVWSTLYLFICACIAS